MFRALAADAVAAPALTAPASAQVQSFPATFRTQEIAASYAFAVQHPERGRRFVLVDAPLPGIGPREAILKTPLPRHFRFGGPDMERLVAGRGRIYPDRFWNEFAAHPTRLGFAQFAAFDQDADGKSVPGRPRQAQDAGARRWRWEVLRVDDGDGDALRCRGLRADSSARLLIPDRSSQWRQPCATAASGGLSGRVGSSMRRRGP